ncbi:MAG: general secretion pathway protein GspH [Leptolyngbyaceae cyanobacterium RU_5_1]|nr:general secretion pathway protein GspH [Leptolyngbyaceae cyanobacterium RU_5_1]
MKTKLKTNFLQHQVRKGKNFTLIQLSVITTTISLLATITLPAFSQRTETAKQAITTIGSMNRAQQAFFLERNQFVAQKDFNQLGLGISPQTPNYTYRIAGGGPKATIVTNQAIPRVNGLKAYIGGAKVGMVLQTSEATTLAVLCEAKKPKGMPGAATGQELVTSGSASAPPGCPNSYVKVTQSLKLTR